MTIKPSKTNYNKENNLTGLARLKVSRVYDNSKTETIPDEDREVSACKKDKIYKFAI